MNVSFKKIERTTKSVFLILLIFCIGCSSIQKVETSQNQFQILSMKSVRQNLESSLDVFEKFSPAHSYIVNNLKEILHRNDFESRRLTDAESEAFKDNMRTAAELSKSGNDGAAVFLLIIGFTFLLLIIVE